MENEDRGNQWSAHFPHRKEEDSQREWESLKRRLTLGDRVTGVVIARAPFGAWIDLGVGFPALLEITAMAELTLERYRAGDWCPVGSRVTADVVMFRDTHRQVYLLQPKAG